MSEWISTLRKPNISDAIFQNHKIYIIPNGYGILYFVIIVVMVLTGATYSNNLIYLLGFFLFSVFVSGMVQTHNNIKKVTARILQVEDCFEGDNPSVFLQVSNNSKKMKQTLRLQVADKKIKHEIPAKVDILDPHKTASSQMLISPKGMGVFQFPKLKLYTNFPMGLFRSWLYIPSPMNYYVYPHPKNFSNSRYQLRGPAEKQEIGKDRDKDSDSDFREHRDYRQGESYRHIDWKAFARGRNLMVKTFEGDTGVQKIFRYSDLVHLNSIERLQQLSFWVKEAHQKKETFQLILPDTKVPLGNNDSHAKAAFRALAEFASHKGGQSES